MSEGVSALTPAPPGHRSVRVFDRLGSPLAYGAATAITVVAILSQYFLPQAIPALLPVYESLGGDLAIVYGIPILAFLLLVGWLPLRSWRRNMETAVVQGVAWYGVLALVALLVSIALIVVYEIVDPGALALLQRMNPDISAAASNPWFWILFSFVIGAFEEVIFRGWIFGYWLARGTPRWFFHAVWTSVLFAGVHLYYGTTYGAAFPILFPELFLSGLAFALTVRYSKGNLVVVAFLHGWTDSTAFLSIVNPLAADLLHYGLIFIGVIVAVLLYVTTSRISPPESEAPTSSTAVPPGAVGSWPPPPPSAGDEISPGGPASAPTSTGPSVPGPWWSTIRPYVDS